MSSVQAAVVAAEELERLLELTATEEATELLATLDEDGGTTIGVLDWLEDETATDDATELLLAGGVVPQPIG